MYVGPCDFHNVLKSTPAYLFLNVCVSVCECERVFTSTVYVFVLCSVSGKSCCFCFWSLQLFPSTNTRRFVKGHFRHPVRTYVLCTRAHVVRFILKLFRMLLRYMFCAGICVYIYIYVQLQVCVYHLWLSGGNGSKVYAVFFLHESVASRKTTVFVCTLTLQRV